MIHWGSIPLGRLMATIAHTALSVCRVSILQGGLSFCQEVGLKRERWVEQVAQV